MSIYFSILGSLTAEVRTDGEDGAGVELDVGPFKQRLLLAMLLCRINAVVLVEQLIDTLWWEGPPRTAHKNIQVYVSHLRKLLSTDRRTDRLRLRPPGYQLALATSEVDALQFEELARAGRLALRGGDLQTAGASIRQGLDLWRGPALSDLLVSPEIRAEAVRLDHRRAAAYEDWFEVELALGHHVDILEEIEALSRAHPLRERLRGQQLTALYRSGRQTEALAEYDSMRQRLAGELGLEPSPVLQQLYQNILSGHAALAAPGRRRQPEPLPDGEVMAHLSGLPRPVDDFVGRREVLGRLLAHVGEGTSGGTHHGRVAIVAGPPGSGTTTLALRAAQLLAPRFADGEIVLRLRDEKGIPRPTEDLLGELSHRIGPVPAGSPAGSGREREGLLRRRLAERRPLLVLDGAADEAQVRPLLALASQCTTILTSCRRLDGLEGVGCFDLGVFTEPEALELLSRCIGSERVTREPAGAMRVVHACGLLPLAVRIAGARLAGLGHLPLERFAERLEDHGRLLDELVIGDRSIRTCFEHYLHALSGVERRALNRLAAAWSPVAQGRGEMEQVLERLAGVNALTITDLGRRSEVAALPFAMPLPLWVFVQQLLDATV
jgi:DNA-binding SARP family transcriptional activator